MPLDDHTSEGQQLGMGWNAFILNIWDPPDSYQLVQFPKNSRKADKEELLTGKRLNNKLTCEWVSADQNRHGLAVRVGVERIVSQSDYSAHLGSWRSPHSHWKNWHHIAKFILTAALQLYFKQKTAIAKSAGCKFTHLTMLEHVDQVVLVTEG